MRQSQSVAGGMVIQCACHRADDDEIADTKEILDGADVRRMWIPQDACMCEGSGWLCWRCLGRRWVTVNGRAAICESCATVENGEVKPQAWLVRFQQAERAAMAKRKAEALTERFAGVGEVVYAEA